ncbi:MAG: hypothetical protein K8T20_16260, partial [Planctomycetes bacterium]|nr:hypothetical protein [Planctomycetota bacterium]
MWTVTRLGAAMILLVAVSASAQGVTAPYTENFDSGLPAGWTISNSSSEGVGWAVDADPAITKVGNGSGGAGLDGPTSGGSAGSLNYNDGINFEEDIAKGANKGVATSPVIDVTALGGAAYVSFDLNMETDFYLSQDNTRDHFSVTVTTDLGDFVTVDFGDNTSPAGLSYYFNSGPMGTFRRVGFDAAILGFFTPGFSTISIDFSFTTALGAGGGLDNAYSGIFIDNLQVCSDPNPPAAPTNLTPLDGSTIVGGLGIPLALDWTDAVDTSSCGAGAVWFYIDEIYDAANVMVATTVTDGSFDTYAPGLPPGTYHWRELAVDGANSYGPYSAFTTFTIEPALPPLAPDTLFVNEGANGAQSGRSGFVDPLMDESPHFSAIYRDGNSIDNAIAYRFQVTTDPTFLTLDFDSGSMGLSPIIPKDSRCLDLTMGISLLRDTVYFWRIQYTDADGATGPFSVAQSFRIADDFEFGVRTGSTHHGRKKCYLATAASGGVTPGVASLMRYREDVLEQSGAGSLFSRAYATVGAVPAGRIRPVFQGGSPIPLSQIPTGLLALASALMLGVALARRLG